MLQTTVGHGWGLHMEEKAALVNLASVLTVLVKLTNYYYIAT